MRLRDWAAKRGHAPALRRHSIGRGVLSNRPHYGWDATCSCGWSRGSNENKAYAMKLWNAHASDLKHKESAT